MNARSRYKLSGALLIPLSHGCRHKEGQMKAFFVGGPNQRKDYHIEAGEEVCALSRCRV